MKKLYSLFVVFFTFVLVACNGSSGANVTPAEQLVATSITIATFNNLDVSQQSFLKNESITVSATVLDQDNNGLSGQKVDFSNTLGELPISSVLTNSEGVAIVTLENANLLLGAGTITANISSLSAQANYEFIDTDELISLPSLISSELLLEGATVNQFKTDQTVQISIKLQSADNQAIVGEIIDFNAEIGTLSANSALTDAQGIASVSLTGAGDLGAGVLTATYRTENISAHLNYQILAADTVTIESGIKIGSFDNNNQFHQGIIGLSVSDNTISAGGTLGLTIDLIDGNGERVQTPTPISFSSNCVVSETATIDESVFTVNGSAQSTFEDKNCAGTTGTDDAIVASVTINGITEVATATISILGEELGSIEFVSAQPTSIVLKGTGGQGKQETSLLTFKVKSSLGNILSQQQVDFSLNTNVGGITISPVSGLTNSQGLITTQVQAGTVPTAVRVSAKASLAQNGNTKSVQTQSDLLSINTGLPEQRSLTIAASVLNPEANGFNGEESKITTWLADNFNNPVPDGTTVNFTTEGGVIEPTCTTNNGSCSVTWRSAEPRVSDHRVTILATALGHESFFDTNGNNSFDVNDGVSIVEQAVSAGFGRITPQSSGFVDMSEAWRDDNENNSYESGEIFLDFNSNNSFDIEDGLFNGPQCSGTLCAGDSAKSIHVRKSLVLIMSGSNADWSLKDSNTNTLLADVNGNGSGLANITDGGSQAVTLYFSDFANQPLPAGTQIIVSLSAGDIAGQTSVSQANTNQAGKNTMQFVLINPVGGEVEVATLTITLTTPKGIVTSIVRSFTLL